MADRPRHLHPALVPSDPIWQLWGQLPPAWRGPIIGPDIPTWRASRPGGAKREIDLTGLPEPFASELAWIAHWQERVDGTPAAVGRINDLGDILRFAHEHNHPLPGSVRAMDAATAEGLRGWYWARRWHRLPPSHRQYRLIGLMGIPRQALIAACHTGQWWELDDWLPRADPRIPLRDREPRPHQGLWLSRIQLPWLREAVKWHLGMKIESGTLRWGTAGNARLLKRFDRWLSSTFDDPRDVVMDPANAAYQAATFRRWAADPANRAAGPQGRRTSTPLRGVNDDLRAVAELFAFMAENPREVRAVLGPSSPWTQATATHAASWARQVCRIPTPPPLDDRNYIDDHAMSQILAALPLLALPRDQHMKITCGDGSQVLARGFGDPQTMRMILLHVLTGRRASEIRTCAFDCLSAVPGRTGAPAGGEHPELTRFHYAQSKIDGAPDTILVDREVVAIIDEQQQWVRDRLPGITPTFLFIPDRTDLTGGRPPSTNTSKSRLAALSALARFTDSAGRSVSLSHTHRFRHTRLTRLAELGLPVKVLQRYAGHATPTMSLHYVAHREEHAEQAFLATAKLRADGSRIEFSREDHDRLHLFDRADRFLPHGWCTLPPMQSCDKGNACLTCSVFVTDVTHSQALERQLAETTALITRSTETFQQRHGRPMPADNVWLAQRHAEHAALTRLLEAMRAQPDRPVQGAGCATAPRATGPVPLELDLTHARRTQP